MYHKWRSYDLWFLRYGAPQTDFFVILDYFLPLDPPNNPMRKKWKKIENIFEKWKKAWRYHHFTQVYQKSWSYAILFLRYMVCDGCNCYFSFWAIFCPFTTLTAPKIKIKKKKITWRYHDHMLYCSWDIWCVTDVVVIFHFGLFFCPFTKTAQKIKISKKKKNTHTHTQTHTQHKTNKKHLEIWSYTCVPKTMIRWSMVPEIWCTTDRQTDRQTDRKSGI